MPTLLPSNFFPFSSSRSGRFTDLIEREGRDIWPPELIVFSKFFESAANTLRTVPAGMFSDSEIAEVNSLNFILKSSVGANFVDKSIVSGLIIQAGDMVIDGSVQGKLSRLATTLQS